MAVINKLPSGSAREQTKTVTAGTTAVTVTPDAHYLLSQVTVNPTPSEQKTQAASTSNVVVNPTSGRLLSKVTITPTPSETKTATPSGSAQNITPSSGKLLSKVTVNAINVKFTKVAGPIDCSSGSTGTINVPAGFHYGFLVLVGSSNANKLAMTSTFTRTGGVTAVDVLQSRYELGRLEARYAQVVLCHVAGNGTAGTVKHEGQSTNNEYMWLYKIY